MEPRSLIILAASIAAGATLIAAAPVLLGPSSPACSGCNVVVVEIDPLRADHLGVYGYGRNTSPVIDSLARDAYVFDRAFTQSGHTVPAAFSLLSGRYVSQHGVTPGDRLDRDGADRTLLLPEVLDDAGYRTYAATSRPWLRQDPTFDQGFDRYITAGAGDTGDARDEADIKFDALRPLIMHGGDRFFLYYQTFATHHPYFPPGNYSGLFEPDLPGFRNESRSRHRALWERLLARDDLAPADRGAIAGREYAAGYYFARAEENATIRDHLIAEYDGTVRYADTIVGRIRALLADAGRLDDTIIIVTAAHGEAFNEHGDWAHGELHNEVMRIPLIVHVPGMDGQRRIDDYVEEIDIGVTLLDMLGIDAPDYRERSMGTSLRPAMQGGDVPGRYVLAEYEQGQVGFIDTRTRYKYLVGREEPPAVYDLARDWAETEPLNDPELRDRMQQDLASFRAGLPGYTDTSGAWPYYGD